MDKNHSKSDYATDNMAFPGGRLSVGTISQICNNGYSQPVVLQVLEVKKMVAAKSTAATGDRYRYAALIPSFLLIFGSLPLN